MLTYDIRSRYPVSIGGLTVLSTRHVQGVGCWARCELTAVGILVDQLGNVGMRAIL